MDGQEVAVVDQFDPGREIPFKWEHKGLQPGRHTFRLTILDQSNPASKGRWVNVDNITTVEAAVEAAGPTFDAAGMRENLLPTHAAAPPLLLMEFKTLEGKRVRLHDYATAGEGEVPYISWLTVTNVAPTPFSNANPLRSGRPLK
jgi:hypothetical protein